MIRTAGAHIQIVEKDKEGNETIVAEWDSTTKAHEVKGLKTDVTYTLRETVAPEGYAVTTDTTFKIAKDGKVTSTGTISTDGVLLVKDGKTAVKVSKVDIADSKEVAGAKLEVIDSEGRKVDSWTSVVDDKSTEDVNEAIHVINGLKTGVTYTLRETVAPEGYTITSDTTFSIDKNGKVTTSGKTSEDGVILVADKKTTVKVSKVDVADGKEVEGAHIQIIEKDKAGNETVVENWVSTKEAHEVEGLKTGVEYTLRETVAPDGYTVTTDTTFTIDETGKVTSSGTVSNNGVLLVEDAKTKVKVSKTDVARKSKAPRSRSSRRMRRAMRR